MFAQAFSKEYTERNKLKEKMSQSSFLFEVNSI